MRCVQQCQHTAACRQAKSTPHGTSQRACACSARNSACTTCANGAHVMSPPRDECATEYGCSGRKRGRAECGRRHTYARSADNTGLSSKRARRGKCRATAQRASAQEALSQQVQPLHCAVTHARKIPKEAPARRRAMRKYKMHMVEEDMSRGKAAGREGQSSRRACAHNNASKFCLRWRHAEYTKHYLR